MAGEEVRHRFEVLREVFELGGLVKSLGWFIKNLRGSIDELYAAEYLRMVEIFERFEGLVATGATFCRQLCKIESARMADDTYLLERLCKASEYFLPFAEEAFGQCVLIAGLEIDNKETKKRIKEAGDEVLTSLDILCRALKAILAGEFSVERYGQIKTACLLEERKAAGGRKGRKLIRIENADGDSAGSRTVNEELRAELQAWRTERFKADNVPAYTIMHQSTLLDIATYVPKTREALLAINGFGKAKYEKYGEAILEITSKY